MVNWPNGDHMKEGRGQNGGEEDGIREKKFSNLFPLKKKQTFKINSTQLKSQLITNSL